MATELEKTPSMIDRDDPSRPLYQQLKDILLANIRKSSPGTSIPTESDLCEKYHVSRQTVRQAITEIVAEGYLTRVKGSGTFVQHPKIERDSRWAFEDFNKEMLDHGITPETRLLVSERCAAPPKVAAKLAISERTSVLHLRRLRFVDGWPLMVTDSYLPYERAHLIGAHSDVLEHRSLRELIEDSLRCSIERARRSVEAIPAPKEEAKLLGVATDSPLLYSETVRFDEHETPVEFAIAWYRGDRSRFTLDFKKKMIDTLDH